MENSVPGWLANPVLNKAEIARQIGLSPAMFKRKTIGDNGNRLTKTDQEKLEQFRLDLLRSLSDQPLNHRSDGADL